MPREVLAGSKKAPVCIDRTMSWNSCDDYINNLLFSVRTYVMEENKWESRWKTQLAPSARRANFPVSFWAWDTLKQRRFGCQAESSRVQTSVRYLIGIATVSQLVSMMSPRPICLGPITSSFHLSIARGHCQTESLSSPITVKIASIIAARPIFMCSILVASINASST
jgi:hypothetical protein